MADDTTAGGAHRGEGAIFGASGILGVNNLQRAIDTFDGAVGKLQGIIGKMGEASSNYSQGQAATGSWNKFSNWAGGKNGGNATINGQPVGGGSGNGGGSNNGGGTPSASGGAHRADGPAQVYGGSSGGAYRGAGNGVAKAAFAVGMVSGGYQMMTQSKDASNQDSLVMNTVASQWSFQNDLNNNARRMFNHMTFAGNGLDAAQTAAEIQANAGGMVGSAGYQSMQNATAQIAFSNPALTGLQAAQRASQFYGPAGYSRLRTVGINTIGSHGQRQSPTQIANQILNQVDPQQTIRSQNDIDALITDPMSNLNITLGNWTANGVISGDQQGTIKDAILQILKARSHGVGVNRLNNLLNRSSTDGNARKALHSMGIETSSAQRLKDLAASKRQGTVDRLPAFTQGLDDATNNLIKFTDALREVTSDPDNPLGRTIGNMQGQWRGQGAAGKGGHVAGVPGFFERRISQWWSNPFSFSPQGGNNETRMSVGGGLTGVSVSSLPHNAGLAAMGGAMAGGPANAHNTHPSSGGGATHSGGGGNSGQRMILPARGKLGVGFGASGSHWSSGHHTGQDIECPAGTPVHAPANGTVIFAGWDGPYGNLVKIDHGGGVVSYMAHNSRLVAHVGAQVRQGQLIAYSGATGNVTGPHCHFEVRVNGTPVNPMRFVSGGSTVSGTGGGGGTSGSGTNAANGFGTPYDGSSGGMGFGGPGMAGGTVGMSELDVLGGAVGAASSMMGSFFNALTGSDPGTSGGGGGGGAANTVGPGKGSGVQRWRGAVVDAMKRLGIKPTNDAVNRTLMQMSTESGGNPTVVNKWDVNWKAGHPSVGLMQVIQGTFNEYAGPFRKTGPFSYGVSTNAEANIYAALNYAIHRYGSIDNAFHGHGYSKGAWDIPKDEIAQVHKNEMIIPAKEAAQIREILVNGNPYKAQGNQAKANSHQFTFAANAIQIHVTSTGNAVADGQAIGKSLVDALQQNTRIEILQTGVVNG